MKILKGIAVLLLLGAAAYIIINGPQALPDLFRRLTGPRLTPAQRWALAAGANLSAPRGDPFDRLELGSTREETQTMLRQWWDVKGPEDAEKTLDSLAHGRHTEVFRPLYRELAHVKPAQLEGWLRQFQPEDRPRLRFVHDHYASFKNGELIGWDLARLIIVARAAYTAGWMDEATAWRHMLAASKRLQSTYSSWAELSENYLLGRHFWGQDEEANRELEDKAHWLLTDPQSPWQSLAWNTPLGN